MHLCSFHADSYSHATSYSSVTMTTDAPSVSIFSRMSATLSCQLRPVPTSTSDITDHTLTPHTPSHWSPPHTTHSHTLHPPHANTRTSISNKRWSGRGWELPEYSIGNTITWLQGRGGLSPPHTTSTRLLGTDTRSTPAHSTACRSHDKIQDTNTHINFLTLENCLNSSSDVMEGSNPTFDPEGSSLASHASKLGTPGLPKTKGDNCTHNTQLLEFGELKQTTSSLKRKGLVYNSGLISIQSLVWALRQSYSDHPNCIQFHAGWHYIQFHAGCDNTCICISCSASINY